VSYDRIFPKTLNPKVLYHQTREKYKNDFLFGECQKNDREQCYKVIGPILKFIHIVKK